MTVEASSTVSNGITHISFFDEYIRIVSSPTGYYFIVKDILAVLGYSKAMQKQTAYLSHFFPKTEKITFHTVKLQGSRHSYHTKALSEKDFRLVMQSEKIPSVLRRLVLSKVDQHFDSKLS